MNPNLSNEPKAAAEHSPHEQGIKLTSNLDSADER